MEEQEQKVDEMRRIVEKQEERIQNLQSNAFKLANFYFVFQGVVLTAISASMISLTCSQRWFPFTLSFLAGMINLVAMFRIGLKYTKTLSQQYQNNSEYQYALQTLHHLREAPASGPSTATSNSLEQNRDVFREASEPGPLTATSNSVEQNRDVFREAKHWLAFLICISVFVAFFCVTLFGCWKIPCLRDECGNLPDNENCINLCDGAKCISVCRDY